MRRKQTVWSFRNVLFSDVDSLLEGGPSLLESCAVKLTTAKDYARRKNAFITFAEIPDLLSAGLAQLEMALLEFFDVLYLGGKDVGEGAKLLSALGYFRPELRQLSRSGLLPRARLALQGWGRLAPTATRLPLPWPVLAGIVVALLVMGHPQAALASVLAADAYLRPGELLYLSTDDLSKPEPRFSSAFHALALVLFPKERGRPSKTHQFDDSVLLDSKGREWINRLLLDLAAGRPGLPLFDLTYKEWLSLFQAAARLLGLADWMLSLYVLRHTGPSHDYLEKFRTLDDIQRRGRWGARSSVRRYEKSAKVTARLNKVPPEIRPFLEDADRHLAAYFEKRRPLPVLPVLPANKRKRATRGNSASLRPCGLLGLATCQVPAHLRCEGRVAGWRWNFFLDPDTGRLLCGGWIGLLTKLM